MVKFPGSLTLIRILLFISGVEQNPGPVDEYIFHYQYLLIEVGTDVMRKVFDLRVGYNFVKYLNANIKESRKLQSLILAKIITPDQAKHLPTIDNNPKSINFDITLLACLLRNVCGLRGHKDPVWKKPSPTDFSLEADLARLKECRNNLQHSGTVFISQTVLGIKWFELSQLLTRLNKTAGIPNLSSLINDVKTKHIDVKLKKEYDAVIKAWNDADKLLDRKIEELKHGQFEIIQGQSEIKDGQCDIVQGQSEIKDGQCDIVQGQSEIKDGQCDIIQGQSEIKDGQCDIIQGQSEIKDGQCDIIQGQSEIKDGHSKIVQGQSSIGHDLSKIIQGQSEITDSQIQVVRGLQEISNTQRTTKRPIESGPKQDIMDELDLRKHLVKIYEKECCTLPVSPLCLEDEGEVELITIYQRPNMCRIPYHRSQREEGNYFIDSYKELFMKEDDHCFRNIYITGDAGVGKTSFCKCMALLWCMRGENIGNDKLQKDVDFIVRFDFVFYLSLRKTVHEDVIDMIADQYFYTRSRDTREEIVQRIEHILKHKLCLVILDGLDEWSPIINETNTYALPRQFPSEKCTYLTTCRPHKIEKVRLSQKDLDIHVRMTGISVRSNENLVKEIVNHINDTTKDNKDPDDFMHDIKRLGLQEHLRIPMITAHLIEVWFDHILTDMSRALMYGNIVNLLLKKAEKKQVKFPTSVACTLQVPRVLTSLVYVKQYFSLLEKICLLSFRSLFKQDTNASTLVFTEEQLMSEPYCLSSEELNCMCKIGIISLNKVFGGFGKQEQQLSFLHNSYTEFFAALFVTSFDLNAAFDMVVKTWKSINDVVQYSDFFGFLAGLSCQRTNLFLKKVYDAITDDLTLCRENMIFHYDRDSYSKQIMSLQTMVINCFHETVRSNAQSMSYKLEDCIFDKDSPVLYVLKRVLLMNSGSVKSLRSVSGEYLDDEFGRILNLRYLHIDKMLSVASAKFVRLMLMNILTLRTISIVGRHTLIQELPLGSFRHLTSLCLTDISMKHNSLDKLVHSLSTNVLFENIKLSGVNCDDHKSEDDNCTLFLNLRNHAQLISLYLSCVNIVCNAINHSSIKSIHLFPLFENIVSCYTDLLTSIRYSLLEHLGINGHINNWFDSHTNIALITALKTLPCIRLIWLWHIDVPVGFYIQLHRDVKQVELLLIDVTMSFKCFRNFIRNLVSKPCVIKLQISYCNIKSVDGDKHRLSLEKSFDYMHRYLTSKYAVLTIIKDKWELYFETKGCQ